jgi:benzoyl-CoA reductase/2-hydroxyglutaryl-CoA dehydratase subunit BcrC/BadD/HgdB
MGSHRKYETKPLDCWSKGKELTIGFFRNVLQAKDQGKKLGVAIGNGPGALVRSIPDCEFIDLTYLFAAETTADSAQSIRFSDAAMARGYLGDICHPNLHLWGSMFLEEGFFTSPMKPDFCIQMHICESQGKGAQVLCEHLGIPNLCIDVPLMSRECRRPFHDHYLAHQLHDAIDWLEKTLGKPFDDEKFIEGVKNEWECRILFGKVCKLQQNVPAPLDLRALQTLCAPGLLLGYEKETVEFYRILYDEVQDRVNRQIASLPTERCRLLHDGPPPYHSLHFFRHVEQYGALFIGGTVEFNAGGFERGPGGSWHVRRTIEERVGRVENREDAVGAIVEEMVGNPAACQFLVFPRIDETVMRAKDWHADAVVFHCDRGCQAFPASMPESKLALSESGIPTMIYESSCADRRELNEAQVIGSLESFMELLGLSPLPS